MHFNLIVDKDDAIVNMLVPREQIKETVMDTEVLNEDNQIIKDLNERLKLSEKSKKEMTERLKISEESKTKLSVDHKKAMTEIGKMKEEIEKFKIEVQTLSEYKGIIGNKSAPIPVQRQDNSPLPVPEPASKPVDQALQNVASPPTCVPQDPWTTVSSSKRKIPNRNGSGSESNQRNCPKCYFQSNSKEEMENHFKMSHVPNGETSKVVIRTERITCRNCKNEFSNYWSLMNHRRDNHPTDKSCRYDLEDRYKHSSEEC